MLVIAVLIVPTVYVFRTVDDEPDVAAKPTVAPVADDGEKANASKAIEDVADVTAVDDQGKTTTTNADDRVRDLVTETVTISLCRTSRTRPPMRRRAPSEVRRRCHQLQQR